MNSTKIKYALLQYFAFKRGYYCCTEFNYSGNISDVFCLDKKGKEIIDIEVKISKQDFLNDFKKKEMKHKMFEKNFKEKYQHRYYPNKFYFCVPKELTEYVKTYLTENNKTWYGIIEIDEVYINGKLNFDRLVNIIRPAKKMFDVTDTNSFAVLKDWMLNRLRNDCVGLYREKVYGSRYDKVYEGELK